jgi:hypothetical protein
MAPRKRKRAAASKAATPSEKISSAAIQPKNKARPSKTQLAAARDFHAPEQIAPTLPWWVRS